MTTIAVSPKLLTKDLRRLRSKFQDQGFDLRLVGGCVRDLLCNGNPKDIDLCTDADPDQQRQIYQSARIPHHDTGLHHGTWTVVMSHHAYEITSLRTETDHDGRHATVAYTRDWMLDLSRRDLTINAMMLDFEGTLYDPFNGQRDLAQGRVVFVGGPAERIGEDYLRILRWLRFHARFSRDATLDAETAKVVSQPEIRAGLRKISRERVWSEMSSIVSGPRALETLQSIIALGLHEPIDLPLRDVTTALRNAVQAGCSAPAVMAAYLASEKAVRALAQKWRWSARQRSEGLVAASYGLLPHFCLDEAKRLVACHRIEKQWLVQALSMQGAASASVLAEWSVPVFPVGGGDLIEIGIKPGPVMGTTLARLKQEWALSEYSLTRTELLRKVSLD